MTEKIVTIADIRAAHLCTRGARSFFEAHGLDWGEFLKRGLPFEAVAALNDELADRVLEAAQARLAEEQ